MISGQVPFPFPSLPEKIQAHLSSEPIPLGSIVPGVPTALAEVVSKMIRKNPGDRYPDPASLAMALEPFAMAESAWEIGPNLGSSTEPPSDRRWRRSRLAIGVAIFLSLGMALAIGVVWRLGRARSGSGIGSSSIANPSPGASSLIVHVVDPRGAVSVCRDLSEAIRADRTIGSIGHRIILQGRGPFRLESTESLEILTGSVTIEGDPATRPVLQVVLLGSSPFLRVGPRGTLTLKGLEIQAEFVGRGPKSPPLIESSGTLVLGQSSFATTEPGALSVAVASEGARLVASGCWFGGFRRAIDVGAFAGTEVILEQCMLIRDPESDPSSGWAIRVRREPTSGSDQPRKLAIRRCTVSIACFLRADDFNPTTPLTITIEETIIQSGAVLTWQSDSLLNAESLRWSGLQNLFDLSRAAWAIQVDGSSPRPGGPLDLDAWSRITLDRSSQNRAIHFPRPDREPRDALKPTHFPAQKGPSSTSIGADPRQIGPVAVSR